MSRKMVLGTGNGYKSADMEFRDANRNDSGYHSLSSENFTSSHFDNAYQAFDHDLETDPSFEAGLLSGNSFLPTLTSHTAPPILSRQGEIQSLKHQYGDLEFEPDPQALFQRPVTHMGDLHLPDSLPRSQVVPTPIPGYEATLWTEQIVPRSDFKEPLANAPSAGFPTRLPPEVNSNASRNTHQKSLEIDQSESDLETAKSGATGPNSKAVAIIRTWIEVSPQQLPSAEDIAYFSNFAKLPPTEINRLFLEIWAEKAVKFSQASKGAIADNTKPLEPKVPSPRSQRVVLANSEALIRAGEWVSQQITTCKPPTEYSMTAQSKHPRVPYPCSFCGRIFSTKDAWRRHEELRCPQEGWLCNLDTVVQIGESSQCTHCEAEDPDMDHFHIEHPEHTRSGPCCRHPFSRRVFKRKDVFGRHLEKEHPSIPIQFHNEIVAQSHFAVPSTFDENCTICQLPESYRFRDWDDRITHLAQHFKKGIPGDPRHDQHDKDDEGKDESDEEDDDTSPKPPRKKVRKSRLNTSGNAADKKTSSPAGASVRQAQQGLLFCNFKEQLTNAFVNGPNSTDCFIPQETFKNLLKRDAVLDELEHSLGNEYLTRGEKRNETVDFVMERATRIFAILVMIGKSKSIIDFMGEDLSDTDLPISLSDIDSSENLPSSHNTERKYRLFENWSKWDLHEFSRFQWSVSTPVFELGSRSEAKHYNFRSHTVLPFVENDEGSRKTGGYSSVWRVKIHPQHQKWNGEPEKLDCHPVAIKKLHSADKGAFEREANALRSFSRLAHPNIVTLLATYQLKEHYHLIFPYADGTLRSYWQRAEDPKLVQHRNIVLWMVAQCKGLADALYAIHNFKTRIENTNGSSGSTAKWEKGEEKFGRHGDIKPENILCFKDEESGGPVLQIADFGLGRFHRRDSRSNVDPASIAGTPTYMPPELDLHLPVSRAYDIWSLGCLYLEFITWYVHGWQGVENFEHARSVDIGGTRDSKFYTILGHKPSNRRSAILRPSVTQWIEELRANPSSASGIKDFLTLVQYSLLVPDPKQRMRAKDIVARLSKMLELSQSDPGYTSSTGQLQKSNNSDPTHDPRKDLRTTQARSRKKHKHQHQHRSI